MKRCDGCVYFHKTNLRTHGPGSRGGFVAEGSDGEPVGQCRIGPPEIIGSGSLGWGRWPLVLLDDYCHAHQPGVDS